MADKDQERQEIEKGFGTGLRAQLERRLTPPSGSESESEPDPTADGAADAPEAPAAELLDVEATTGTENGAAHEVDLLRTELQSAIGRERDLRAAMAEQAAMLE